MQILRIEYLPLLDPKILIQYKDPFELVTAELKLTPAEFKAVALAQNLIDRKPEQYESLREIINTAGAERTDGEESR